MSIFRRIHVGTVLKRPLLAAVLALAFTPAYAQSRLAILDFELTDLTLMPRLPAERERTASVKPLLEQELRSAGYALVDIPAAAQQQAELGVGYLFTHHDAAAQLAQNYQADYVLVGRLHKPSFLFVYLTGHLIRVRDGAVVGNYSVEVKGQQLLLTRKGVETLADKVDADLDNRYTPPPPKNHP